MQSQLLRISLLLVFAVSILVSQDLEFSGYYENQFFPQEVSDKIIFQDYNKLRLDISADIGENVSFTGDYIYQVFHGKTTLNAFDFLPKGVVQTYADSLNIPANSLRPLFDIKLENENFLDNAYVTLYFKRFNLRVGKQQLPWGAGYTWNPTDIFNEKNTLDPAYEKVGVNAFKVEVPFSSEGVVTGILGIEEDWETSTKALKVKQHTAGFDFSASFVEKNQEGINYYQALEFSEKRRLIGGDFSGEVLGLGVWGEGAYNFLGNSANFGQYLFGTDYTFESGLYLIGEYYRNDRGKTDHRQYNFNDWMRLLSADGENLGQDYLFLGEQYPIGELWNWSNFLILNLNDRSTVFFPWFDYSLNDNTELIFTGYLPFGRKKTEFGSFGAGGFARIRVYF
mgnify:CR=1 FL=1